MCNRPFRYEVAWETHQGFGDFVSQTWNPNSNFFLASSNFKKEVVNWNKEVFRHIRNRKKRTLARIAGINEQLERNWSHSLATYEEKLRSELFDILKQEELLWYQKSRKKWLTDGDRNTQFFHVSTMSRRKRNKIDRLQTENGEWVENQEGLKILAIKYFESLFSANDLQPLVFESNVSFLLLDIAVLRLPLKMYLGER